MDFGKTLLFFCGCAMVALAKDLMWQFCHEISPIQYIKETEVQRRAKSIRTGGYYEFI